MIQTHRSRIAKGDNRMDVRNHRQTPNFTAGSLLSPTDGVKIVPGREKLVERIAGLVPARDRAGGAAFVEPLKQCMPENDRISGSEVGLDAIRHDLGALRQCRLEDARLIIRDFQGENAYPRFDPLLMEPEFADMADRAIITGAPNLPGSHASSPMAAFFRRRFINAAAGVK